MSRSYQHIKNRDIWIKEAGDDISIVVYKIGYSHFYNNERIKLKIKLTPLEKRSQFVD